MGAAYQKETERTADLTDEALMSRAQSGDTGAFEVLVRRYETPLFNYIRRTTGSAADAEDLFQETFLRVYQHRERFRRGAPVRPWVYQIATNLCRDVLRKRRRRPQVSLDAASPTANGTSLMDTAKANDPAPSAVAGAHELGERLERALARLSVKHRSVFLMARYDGMPYEDIARALRIPVGTVKSRMNKAVDFLMRELKEGVE